MINFLNFSENSVILLRFEDSLKAPFRAIQSLDRLILQHYNIHCSFEEVSIFVSISDDIKSLLQNTPAVKELDTVESFRKEKNGLQINAELEKRTPTTESNFMRGDITKRTPYYNNIDPQDTTEFDNFAQTSPILWTKKTADIEQKFIRTPNEEGPGPPPEGGPDAVEPHVTAEDSLDDMPNTAGPNPNIFGGFPENDVWGNFELPAPDTIDHLKIALKMSHHRPNYAGNLLLKFIIINRIIQNFVTIL